jgi:hypothetical protein
MEFFFFHYSRNTVESMEYTYTYHNMRYFAFYLYFIYSLHYFALLSFDSEIITSKENHTTHLEN